VSAARPAGEIPTASQQEGSPGPLSELRPDELEVIRRVRDSLRSISFGTVLIVVQDGKVVQIETAEKIRLR
jgi:hypothetical protein